MPTDATACCELGQRLQDAGQYEEAEAAYRRAIELTPSSVAAWSQLAIIMHLCKRDEESIAAYQAVLRIEPKNSSAYNEMGMLLQAAGRCDEALAAYRELLQLIPDDHVVYNNIATVLQEQGHFEAALEQYRTALKIMPNFALTHCNLGTCLLKMGRLDESLQWFANGIEHDPLLYLAHHNLVAILSELGRTDEAIAVCRHAIKINPEWSDMHSSLLFILSHGAGINATELFKEHQRFGKQFETPWLTKQLAHGNERDAERVLRVGFVSADLYNHAMANFITPVLENLTDATGLELYIYCNNRVDDHITTHLRKLIPKWQEIQYLSNDQLAQRITADGIDILIDLSGHSGHNRLPVFARKPAPLQLSWIGYAMTTGLQAIDYYVSDPFLSPPGLLDDQFTEKLLSLPAGVAYLPAQDVSPIAPAPVSANGYLTFGSFNRANKLSRGLLARWAALLRAVPDARMVIAAMPDEKAIAMIRDCFASEGIVQERLSFHKRTGAREYMDLHRLVDVCLDTAPYPGGTTTYNALWMGVPTLTMTGPTLLGRIGAAIAGHMGLPEYIAQDEADFIRKGVAIAANVSQVISLRGKLRARFAESAMGQPALIAAGLDSALRAIWRRWCAGLAPVAFTADATQSSLSLRASSNKALHAVNVDVAIVLAIEHHQAGHLVEAETLYLAILHGQPQHAVANHNMGLLAAQIGYYDRALPYLRAATQSSPGEVQFILSYTQCLLQAGQAHDAIEVISNAIDQGMPTGPLQAQLLQARSEAAGDIPAPTEAEANQIIGLYEAGYHNEMENAAQRMVVRYPRSVFAWSVLGTALQAQGKDSIPALQYAVQVAPDDAQAHENLGNAWQGKQEHARAIACYLRAIDLDPTFAQAYSNMGSAQHAMGDAVGAADSLRRAALIDPMNALAHANLGNVLAELGNLQEAAASYDAALAIIPDDVQLHRDLAQVLRALGRIDEAAASNRQADLLTETQASTSV
ncbi:tetratricopeptide repeat protein [Janthinobacterium sp. PSRC1-1]